MKVFEDLTLKDVAPLTESTDYKDRFLGEFLETKIRYNKLHKMLIKAEAHNLILRRTVRLMCCSNRFIT